MGFEYHHIKENSILNFFALGETLGKDCGRRLWAQRNASSYRWHDNILFSSCSQVWVFTESSVSAYYL